MKKELLLSLLLVAPAVEAGVYACDKDGRKVYQSTPCNPRDRPVDITPHNTIESPASAKPRSPEEILKDVEESRAKGREIVEQRAKEARQRRLIKEAIRDKRVMIGMTKEDVIASWGRPSDINRTVRSSGVREQWVYRRKSGNTQYVYIRNGKVTSISY